MESLSAFLPQDRRLALARSVALPDRANGAALFADIAGFTPLAEALVRTLGAQRGAEELTRRLNQLYDVLIAEADRYGGSIVSFSGDALIGWFDEQGLGASDSGLVEQRPQAPSPKPQAPASLRAAACALAMQQSMRQFADVPLAGHDTQRLALKTAVAAGPVRRFLVGDPSIQYLDVLAGATLDRLAAAEHQARRGEVVLDGPAADSLGDSVRVAEWRADATGARFAIVGGLRTTGAELQASAPALAPHTQATPGDLRPWVLPAVYERLSSGQDAFLGELRPVVAMFLGFSGIDYDADPAAGAKLDAYVRWAQRAIMRYDGTLLQVTIGDKGSNLYITFGAPIAHEDDARRALLAAFDLREPPPDLSFIGPARVGISRGTMRTGASGGATRRTYAVLGDEVNLAARLMQIAAPGQIIASQRVARATSRRFRFDALGSVDIKGKQDRVPIFEVVDGRAALALPELSIGRERHMPAAIVGRQAERTQLAECLQVLLRGGAVGPVLIEGEAGIGKSCLVDDLLQTAREAGVTCFAGAGDPIEQSASYHAWRPIFSQLFQLDTLPENPEAQRDFVLAELAGAPDLLRVAPLLNAVLPLDLPENALTGQMSGLVRADNTIELLARLLQRAASAGPLLLLIEDAHWLDSASWELMRRVGRDIQPLLPVIVSRPLAEPLPPEYHQLWSATGTLRLRLEALPATQITALVCQRLGVAEIPAALAELIQRKAEGHPFFSEELAYALRDGGLIVIADSPFPGAPGRCAIAPDVDLSSIHLPDTIQGAMASRIDRLPPAHQLALKVASVIGRVFAFRALRDVYPVEADRPRLASCLEDLQRLDLTLFDTPEPDLAYLFKHAITQEVAYNLMLFVQRRELHEAVARWHESAYAGDLSLFYPLLAYHWRRAESIAPTIVYLEKAGQQALSRGAYQEAREFFADLLELDDGAGGQTHPDRRARWMSGLAQAYRGLGLLGETRRYAEQAVAVLDRPAPAGQAGVGAALLREIARQALRRLLPGRFTVLAQTEAERANLLEASKLYMELVAVYWSANQRALNLYTCVRRLNIAERAGPSGQLVTAYGIMAFACAAVGLHGLAKRYYARILATDAIVQEPLALATALNANSLGLSQIGEWKTIQADISRTNQIHAQFGDWRGWSEGINVLGTVDHYIGEYAHSLASSDELLSVAQRNGNILHQIWALRAKAYNALHLGRANDAIAWATDAATSAASNAERISELSCYGILAQAHWMLGDQPAARRYAELVTRMIEQSPVPAAQYAYEGYFNAARVWLELWATEPASREARAAARQICGFLKTFARVFPIGAAALHLYRGLYRWLDRRPAAARDSWRKSLAGAQRYGLPYEEALAHYAIGRHASGAEQRQHLDRAAAIFERLGATCDLEQARAALVQHGLAAPQP